MVGKRGTAPIIALLIGFANAVGLLFIPQGSSNDNPAFLIFCGAAAISSMIIPGVSGSYVLLLLGNYALVLGRLETGISDLVSPSQRLSSRSAYAFTRSISDFKHHHDIAVSLITGFIVGSLVVIWPWKDTVYKQDAQGAYT